MKKYITTHEQLKYGKKVIKDNEEAIKKLSTSPLDFNKYLDKKFKVENNIENNKNNVFSEIEIADSKDEQLKAGKEVLKKLQELTRKLRSL